MICNILRNASGKLIYPWDIWGNQMIKELLISLFLSSLILIIPASLMAWERTEITLSEPAIMLLLGSGLLGMGILVRRKFKRGLWLIRGYRVTKSPSTERRLGFFWNSPENERAPCWKGFMVWNETLFFLFHQSCSPMAPSLDPDKDVCVKQHDTDLPGNQPLPDLPFSLIGTCWKRDDLISVCDHQKC